MNIVEGAELKRQNQIPQELFKSSANAALGNMYKQLGPLANEGLGKAFIDYTMNMGFSEPSQEVMQTRSMIERTILKPLNDRAELVRDHWYDEKLTNDKGHPTAKALAKANLDVGSLTNFANVVGGQALG